MVYADAESGKEVLYRIRDIDGAWSTAEVIVDEGWAGEYLDVAIDSTDEPHIAFTILETDEVTRGLYYIYLDEDDVWSGIYDVDTGVNMPPLQEGEEPTEPTPFDVGLYVDIELDNRDNPLFAYMDKQPPSTRCGGVLPNRPHPDAGPGLPDHRKHRSLHQLGSRQCEPCAHGIPWLVESMQTCATPAWTTWPSPRR